jgi:predicted dehydrogenase
MSKQYKAAIVGCGSIGQAHMQGYERLDNVDVVAVVDPLAQAPQRIQHSSFSIDWSYSRNRCGDGESSHTTRRYSGRYFGPDRKFLAHSICCWITLIKHTHNNRSQFRIPWR